MFSVRQELGIKCLKWKLTAETQCEAVFLGGIRHTIRVPGNGDSLILHLTVSYHTVRENCVLRPTPPRKAAYM